MAPWFDHGQISPGEALAAESTAPQREVPHLGIGNFQVHPRFHLLVYVEIRDKHRQSQSQGQHQSRTETSTLLNMKPRLSFPNEYRIVPIRNAGSEGTTMIHITRVTCQNNQKSSAVCFYRQLPG